MAEERYNKLFRVTDDNQIQITKPLVLLDTVWDDLRVPMQNTKINPTKSEPAFETFIGGTYTYAFSATNADDESLLFSAQLPHSYKIGTNLKPHIHWSPSTTNTGNVVFELEYTAASIYGTIGATTSTTTTIESGGVAFKHQLAMFDDIDGSDLGLSSMIICRLTRLGTDAADTFTGKAFVLEFDFHFEIDTPGGSYDEYSKA